VLLLPVIVLALDREVENEVTDGAVPVPVVVAVAQLALLLMLPDDLLDFRNNNAEELSKLLYDSCAKEGAREELSSLALLRKEFELSLLLIFLLRDFLLLLVLYTDFSSSKPSLCSNSDAEEEVLGTTTFFFFFFLGVDNNAISGADMVL